MTAKGRHRSQPGFTLIEVVIAITVSIALSAGAMTLLLSARRTLTEGILRAEMARDAQLVLDHLSHDLTYLGAAVPFGNCADPGPAPCGGNDLLPVVRRAQPASLVFVGDLPYPNAEVNGVMNLVEVVAPPPPSPPGPNDLIKVTSELSGACTPPSSGASGNRVCDTRQFSSLTLDPTTSTPCNTANPQARTCPWGLGKWQPGAGGDMFFQAVTPTSTWYERGHSADFSGTGNGQLQNGPQKLRIDIDNGATAYGVLPLDAAGIGSYLTTLDRVFWSLEEAGSPGTACSTNCVVRRQQCWGELGDPSDADFPSFANADYFPSPTNTPNNCAAGDGIAQSEVIATGLTAARFTYLVGDSATPPSWMASVTTATNAMMIRAIRVELTFQRTPATTGNPLVQTYRRDFFLDNRDTP